MTPEEERAAEMLIQRRIQQVQGLSSELHDAFEQGRSLNETLASGVDGSYVTIDLAADETRLGNALEIVGPLATQLLKAAREVQIERMLSRAAQLKTHSDNLYKEVLMAWGRPSGKT